MFVLGHDLFIHPGKSVSARGKAAIEPVWYLPGIADRLGVKEGDLRRALFEYTGAMFSELVTRFDLKVFLPPIGGITLYMFGKVPTLWDGSGEVACRVHDECNGSDVFGSDICTCRPYLTHGIEECIKTAQRGGAGPADSARSHSAVDEQVDATRAGGTPRHARRRLGREDRLGEPQPVDHQPL